MLRERLWQMDFTRRVVFKDWQRFLARPLYPPTGPCVLSLFATAVQEARNVSGELRALVEFYCSGVNAWIEFASRNKLPLEFMFLGYQPAAMANCRSLGGAS